MWDLLPVPLGLPCGARGCLALWTRPHGDGLSFHSYPRSWWECDLRNRFLVLRFWRGTFGERLVPVACRDPVQPPHLGAGLPGAEGTVSREHTSLCGRGRGSSPSPCFKTQGAPELTLGQRGSRGHPLGLFLGEWESLPRCPGRGCWQAFALVYCITDANPGGPLFSRPSSCRAPLTPASTGGPSLARAPRAASGRGAAGGRRGGAPWGSGAGVTQGLGPWAFAPDGADARVLGADGSASRRGSWPQPVVSWSSRTERPAGDLRPAGLSRVSKKQQQPMDSDSPCERRAGELIRVTCPCLPATPAHGHPRHSAQLGGGRSPLPGPT